MAYTDIRDRLTALVAAVGSVGNVLNRERRAADLDPAVFRTIFQPADPGPINAWEVYRTAVVEETATDNEQANVRHTFTLEGWYSFDDDAGGGEGSDATFQGIVDDVRAALRFAGDLSGDAFMVDAPQVASIDRAMLGEYLCDHCTLTVDVVERVLGANTDDTVPVAPTAVTHDQMMTDLSAIISAAITSVTVTKGRNFPLIRSQRHALLVPLPESDIDRASDQVLERWPVLVRLSYDILDTTNIGDDAVGEDAARHVRTWVDSVQSGWHRKTIADITSVTGLVYTEAVTTERPSERVDAPWRARVEAAVECVAYVWRSTA